MFTRRHYQYIADTIARMPKTMNVTDIDDIEIREYIAKQFSKEFAKDSTGFKEERFLKVCGVMSKE